MALPVLLRGPAAQGRPERGFAAGRIASTWKSASFAFPGPREITLAPWSSCQSLHEGTLGRWVPGRDVNERPPWTT